MAERQGSVTPQGAVILDVILARTLEVVIETEISRERRDSNPGSGDNPAFLRNLLKLVAADSFFQRPQNRPDTFPQNRNFTPN
jgi:hypothetical protein